MTEQQMIDRRIKVAATLAVIDAQRQLGRSDAQVVILAADRDDVFDAVMAAADAHRGERDIIAWAHQLDNAVAAATA